MRCDAARDVLAAGGGRLAAVEDRAEVDDHLATCPRCRAAVDALDRLEADLRRVDHPDLVPRVVESLGRSGRREPASRRRGPRRGTAAVVAAAAVAGIVAGVVFAGSPGRPRRAAEATGLPQRVVAAQAAVDRLSADVKLREWGWHPDVPERRFAGTLRYAAPESLALSLADRTAYPSAVWSASGWAVVADGSRWWSRGPRPCPTRALPACAPATPLVRVVDRPEPFADQAPLPLELITPVQSFTGSAPPPLLGRRDIDGREAIGVRVDAAQVEPLLATLHLAGNLRDVHPTDRADLWLDREILVPLELTISASADPYRARWAGRHGYGDAPGSEILELRLRHVDLGGEVAWGDVPTPPAGADGYALDATFVDAPAEALPDPVAAVVDAVRPPGFELHRTGLIGGTDGRPVYVAVWTDGRAWVKVRIAEDWRGERLFGTASTAVREVGLGAGTGYLDPDATTVAVHGDDVDLAVTGSVGSGALVDVAARLPVRGRPVPATWPEAATATVADARRVHPGLLVLTGEGAYGPPAVRVDGATVTLVHPGPGAHLLTLVETPGRNLTPPLDPDAVGVDVRDRAGRYNPARDELEWVEGGLVLSLRSPSLGPADLLAVAESLERR